MQNVNPSTTRKKKQDPKSHMLISSAAFLFKQKMNYKFMQAKRFEPDQTAQYRAV